MGRNIRCDLAENESRSVDTTDGYESRISWLLAATGIVRNKRTILGFLFWAVGAFASLTPRGFAVGVPAVALGAYLVLYPR